MWAVSAIRDSQGRRNGCNTVGTSVRRARSRSDAGVPSTLRSTPPSPPTTHQNPYPCRGPGSRRGRTCIWAVEQLGTWALEFAICHSVRDVEAGRQRPNRLEDRTIAPLNNEQTSTQHTPQARGRTPAQPHTPTRHPRPPLCPQAHATTTNNATTTAVTTHLALGAEPGGGTL